MGPKLRKRPDMPTSNFKNKDPCYDYCKFSLVLTIPPSFIVYIREFLSFYPNVQENWIATV